MSQVARCDLNGKGDVFKLHDLCHNPRRKCQKQITFTPRELSNGKIMIKKYEENNIQTDRINVEYFHQTWIKNS